ncbi:MAG: transporter substrate-binding domain-containing protein [Christensenellaceae bacterium]
MQLVIFIVVIIVVAGLLVGLSNRKSLNESFLATQDTITIGLRSDIAPFGSLDEHGEIAGYDRDYIDAVLAVLFPEGGKLYDYVEITSLDAGANIKYGVTDINLGLLIPGADKVSGFLLTEPYCYDRAVVVTHGDSRLDKLENMQGGKLGVLNTTIPISRVEDFLEERSLSYEVLRYTDYESIMIDISNGVLNAVVVPEVIAQQFENAGFRVLAEPLFDVGYAIMLPTGQTAVQSEFNRIIHQFEQDGTAGRLREKWGISQN